MDAATALKSAAAVLQRPSNILPAYFLTPAVSAVTRTVSLFGIAVVYLYLETTGRLARFREELAARDIESPPSAETNPDAFDTWVREITPLVETVVTPTTVAIVAATILATIVVSVILVAVASAAQLSASHARLCSERGTTAALRGGRRFWGPILVLRLLELALWAGILAAVGIVIAVVSLLSPIVAALVALAAFPVTVGLLVGIRLVFIFAPVAVIVDEGTVGPSLRRSVGFLTDNPVAAGAYVLIALGGFLTVGSLGGAFATQGSGVLFGLLGFTLLSPGLDLVKTAFYGDYRGEVDPPGAPEGPLGGRFRAGLSRGIGELFAFVRGHPLLHVASLAVGVAGFALGWVAIEPFLGGVSTSIADRLAGHNPLVAAVEFGANNWTVAVSSAFAGLVLAVPAAGALLFNGFVFGVIARTEETLLELLAFVVPHGILEIPAFIVAGALGFWLGGAGWRTLRGQASAEALADAIDRAFWVAIGLGVLLAIAAVIEGFVSPYYYRPFL
ncbi:stage II sporulation protein M [Natronomonas halophila]|uniref:stage II sporulation protein M n=1 Tax=Natronomonas halophila TaxID=2747817 RepID=UPI0015B75B4B|nr:stage II sporulation protein M [Natronomonas halophila]QLD86295.1 stage II sporulation protein M [Natronomonas halophila]